MSIFDIINDLLKEKTGKLHLEREFKKEFNVYGLCKWLSMRPDLIEYADFINTNSKVLSQTDIYLALTTMIPKTPKTFIKYIKKSEEK
jgi:hypothetical protein